MKKALVVLVPVVLAAAVAVWLLMPAVTRVADVRKAETLILRRRFGFGEVHAYSIRVTGRIEGHATLSLMSNGRPYKVADLHGDVNVHWGGDWYSETAELRYEPAGVDRGELTIHYDFSRL